MYPLSGGLEAEVPKEGFALVLPDSFPLGKNQKRRRFADNK
ncbi:hypothetical protein SDC9_191690 [bioreactor metagenome]|uniref:Uncharacterized protein n=1 Tax=bioreactor metagenome TaxID=1076179 RepID=A0A645I110_9ZZZZ